MLFRSDADGDRRERALQPRVVEGVPTHTAFRQLDAVQPEVGKACEHRRLPRQQPDHLATPTLGVGERLEQIQEAAALGDDRLAGGMVRAQGGLHPGIGGELIEVQFRIAPRQVQRIRRGQRRVDERREEGQLGAQGTQ
mgnify:CR=1 FL=1